jgi:hypothetical protein
MLVLSPHLNYNFRKIIGWLSVYNRNKLLCPKRIIEIQWIHKFNNTSIDNLLDEAISLYYSEEKVVLVYSYKIK